MLDREFGREQYLGETEDREIDPLAQYEAQESARNVEMQALRLRMVHALPRLATSLSLARACSRARSLSLALFMPLSPILSLSHSCSRARSC